MSEITIKQGEGKWLRFRIIDTETGLPPTGIADAEFAFAIKAKVTDTAYIVYYDDTAFNKTDIADGIVKVQLLPADTIGLSAKQHLGELKTDFGGEDVDKSTTIIINVEAAVIKAAPVPAP